MTRAELEESRFVSCDDVSVIANLIKVYFREMPEKLLNTVDPQMIGDAETVRSTRSVPLGNDRV